MAIYFIIKMANEEKILGYFFELNFRDFSMLNLSLGSGRCFEVRLG